MSNAHHFTGRLGAAIAIKHHGETKVAKFNLIRNEYAGKDRPERVVSIQFTAFDARAEALAAHVMKGDQLIVTARVENNNYERDGEDVYGFNFIIEDFEFGATGKLHRDYLAQQGGDAD